VKSKRFFFEKKAPRPGKQNFWLLGAWAAVCRLRQQFGVWISVVFMLCSRRSEPDMNLLGNARRQRAIAAYARTLPTRLVRDYGASTTYTPGQIARAIANLKLDPAYAAYAYATFLPEDAYRALQPAMPATPTYTEARAAFVARVPSASLSKANFSESGAGFNGAGLIDGGS